MSVVPPGNLDHHQAFLVLPGCRHLGLHHEGVHPAADVPGSQAHLEIKKEYEIFWRWGKESNKYDYSR